MRMTHTFTDGRIHVTFTDGAYDLQTLSERERGLYETWIDHYEAGADLETLRDLEPERVESTLRAIHRDLCQRIWLDEQGKLDTLEMADLEPWRPDEMRRRFRTSIGSAIMEA